MSWIDRTRPRRRRATLTLFTGPSCGLCETLKAELKTLGAARHFDLQEVDITKDRTLKKRYGLSIPVLELDGQLLLSGRIDPAELRRALSSARP